MTLGGRHSFLSHGGTGWDGSVCVHCQIQSVKDVVRCVAEKITFPQIHSGLSVTSKLTLIRWISYAKFI